MSTTIQAFEITITTPDTDDPDFKDEHPVNVSMDEDIPVCSLVMAAEYLLALAANKSSADFEDALDSMRQGAMTWKTTTTINAR